MTFHNAISEDSRKSSSSNESQDTRLSSDVTRRSFLAAGVAGVAGIGALGSVGQASAATGEHTLVIKGYFDRSTSYSFTVGSNLEKSTANGATITKGQDNIVGQSAHGQVTSGKDAYTFDGPLYSFDVNGSDQFEVTLDGKPARVGRRPDKLLLIEGQGESTSYSFTAGENLSKSTAYGASINDSDEVIDRSAHGGVGNGKDAYTFDGELHSFDFDYSGSVRVTINGLPAHVGSRPDHTLLIEGFGTNTEYTFSTGGYCSKSNAYDATIDSSDNVGGQVVEGSVSTGKDAYTFDEDLETFDFDESGEIRVTIDGKAAHVGGLPEHLLWINGNGAPGNYEFSVSENVYVVDSVGVGRVDEVNEKSASGEVGSNTEDIYAYDGELTSLSLGGEPPRVYSDGNRIYPNDF